MVPPITVKDVEEIFDVKEALGSILVRKAAEHITEEGAAELEEALERLKKAAAAGQEVQWTEAHDHYDRTLFQIARHKRLEESLVLLENQWYRLKIGYSSISESMSSYVEDTLFDHYEQHKAICDAIISRNPDLAVEKYIQHIQRYSAGLIKIVREILMPLLGQEL
jgi:DNA-binding GntR family transcriptional regulator